MSLSSSVDASCIGVSLILDGGAGAGPGPAHDAARQRCAAQLHRVEDAAQVILRCLFLFNRLQSLPEQRCKCTVVHFGGAPPFESA